MGMSNKRRIRYLVPPKADTTVMANVLGPWEWHNSCPVAWKALRLVLGDTLVNAISPLIGSGLLPRRFKAREV